MRTWKKKKGRSLIKLICGNLLSENCCWMATEGLDKLSKLLHCCAELTHQKFNHEDIENKIGKNPNHIYIIVVLI